MALSGGEQVVLNSLERALSTDMNRLQAFRTRDMAEVFRNLVNVYQGHDDLDAGGLYEPATTTTNPLTAEIYSGLLVQPQVGSLNLLVTAGLAYVVTPQTTTDNSDYEFVNDPGVQTLGSLVMAVNSGGSIRIDVIECQPQDSVLESDSRDIFNPITGLFVATTVTKAVAAQMVYRVRQGTVGGGFPGTASGWLPLCVASVPAGATSNDTMTFWDVRPLLNDRAPSLQAVALSTNRNTRLSINGSTPSAIAGFFEAVSYPTNGQVTRRLGGQIRRGSPGVDGTTIAIGDATLQEPGFAGPTNGLIYLYALTYFLLPRWARYTDYTTGSRQPRSPRGMIVVSNAPPLMDGSPSRSILTPSSTGLSGASPFGICFAAFATGVTISGNVPNGVLQGMIGTEDGQILTQVGSTNYAKVLATASSYNSGQGFSTTLIPGTHFPGCARKIQIQYSVELVTSGSLFLAAATLEWLSPVAESYGGNAPPRFVDASLTVLSSTTYLVSGSFWIDNPTLAPSIVPGNLQFAVQFGSNGLYSSGAVYVTGWKF